MSEDRDDIADSDAQSRCCSYCRLPPRAPDKKLKRCSRCHRAWYHDAECQKQHFPLHKRDCQTWYAERLRTAKTAQGNGTTTTITTTTITTTATTTTTTTTTSAATIRKHKRRSRPVPSTSPPLFVVEQREGRGKCLLASPGTTLRRGDRITDPRTSRDAWDPLVAPVLLEEFRASRCDLCFCRLAPRPSGSDYGYYNSGHDSCSFDESSTPKSPLYRLSFCSTACRGVAAERGMQQEERDAYALWKKSNGRGPPRIFATAILLYRILVMEEQSQPQSQRQQSQQLQQSQSDASTLDQLRDLQSKPRRGTSDADADADTDAATDDDQSLESRYHTQGVIATAMGMLRCSESPVLSRCRPSMEHLVDTVHKIKINGFSITYEEDLERIGVGLYGLPSFMNHSCRPNALQTFSLARARLPSLTVTAFREIAPGEEICISYTDASCPSRVRRKRLEEDYGFVCFCEACDTRGEQQDDSRTLALSCCRGSVRSRSSTVVRTDKGAGPSGRPRYECTECGRTDFGSALRQIGEFEAELLLSESNGGDGSTLLRNQQQYHQQQRQRQQQQLTDAYQTLKRLCRAESWYVRQAGDRLLQHHLAKLPELANDPPRERATAAAALAVAEELLLPNDDDDDDDFTSESSTSAFLQRQQLLYKTAKLRLFLFPDPRRSIGELQQVLGALEPYFAQDHPLIVGLKACLAGAMM